MSSPLVSSPSQAKPDPKLPPDTREPVPLSHRALANDLKSQVDTNPKLEPLLIFLKAAEQPQANYTATVADAADKIREDIRSSNSDGDADEASDSEDGTPKFSCSDEVLEGDGNGILTAENEPFCNWGRTVQYQPSSMWVVRTVTGVKNLVKWAALKHKRVRVAGFRHTWSNLYGEDKGILLMFLPMETLVNLPYQSPGPDWKSELQGITGPIQSVGGRQPSEGHAFFKVMAGTTNEDFRKWCFNNKRWCLPFNVIMIEVTFGGTNAPICHGAGLSSTTLSDLVVEVAYIDAHGEDQVVNDPQELLAASGCFGLLGVVISITLQLDEMSIAELAPVQMLTVLAIPPPENYNIPKAILQQMSDNGITDTHLKEARDEFIKRCEDYYVEWFWFPYQDYCWVNTWKKRAVGPQDVDIKTYPDGNLFTGVEAQEFQATVADNLSELLMDWKCFNSVTGYMQAFTLGLASLVALPNSMGDEKQDVYVSDALHFRRGIQNFRVWDTEWEIPIPSRNGKRNYEMVQTAWWDGISAIYEATGAPVRVALEMRLTGGSNVLLAPQRGNTLGTVSIEAITTLTTDEQDWTKFRQTITDKWTTYTDDSGNYLKARPHWAKQWDKMIVQHQPIEDYLKENVYKEAFTEFRAAFESIVTSRNCSVKQTRDMFGNAILDRLIFD